MTSVYTLFFDGCSKGNPGESGAGAVIFCDDKEIHTESFLLEIEKQITWLNILDLSWVLVMQ